MGDEPEVRWPYTPFPGGGTPPTGQDPEEQRAETRWFFWFSVLCTVIIVAIGVTVWAFVH